MATQSPLNLLPLDQNASAGDTFDGLEFVVSPPESPGNPVATGVTENENGTYTVSSTAPFGDLGYAGGNDPTITDYTVTLGVTTVTGDPVYQFDINFYQDFSTTPFLSEDYKVDGWNSTSILLQNLNTDPDYTGNAYLILSSANIVNNGGTSGNLPSDLTFGYSTATAGGAPPFGLTPTTFTLNNPSGLSEAQTNVSYISATKNSDGTYTVYNDGGGDDGAFSTNTNDTSQATGNITLYSDANDPEVQTGKYYPSTRALVFDLRAANGFNYVVGADNATSYDGQIVGWNSDSILINVVSGINPNNGAVAGATQNYYLISAENLANSGLNNGVPLTSGTVFDQDPTTLQEAAQALGLSLTISCFTPGARIQTPAGGCVAVETLRTGDAVTAVDAAGNASLAFVRWVGRRRLDIANHPEPEMVAPIRFRAGSLGDGLPVRDLLLSPDHCLAIDGCLVRAFRLVNGVSIVQECDWPSIEYLHIELPSHGLLLAEGVLAESYLDEGHRGFFDETPSVSVPGSLQDSSARPGACLPFAPDDAFVESIWQRLTRRAGVRWLPAGDDRAEVGLQVQADGRRLRPVLADNVRHIYALPPSTRELRLVSPTQRPTDLRPWAEDRRRLGVCVRAVVLDDGADIALDGPALGDGWWPAEGGGRLRWTTGDAVLTVPPATRCVELLLAS